MIANKNETINEIFMQNSTTELSISSELAWLRFYPCCKHCPLLTSFIWMGLQ
jgi:hypothetical protein